LFNHGAIAKQSVDFVDTVTTDVFSTIEGKADWNIDNENLFEGARVLFTKDTDLLVAGKIYTVKFITTQTSPLYSTSTSQIVIDGVQVDQVTGISRQISLIETEDTTPQSGECVYIKRGKKYKGNMFHYDGTSWILSQRKIAVQQAPLFDCFDSDGVSFADTSVYPASTFAGSKLLSYIVGTSSVTDTELNFKLSYLNIDNVGDIQFNFDFDNDKFSHQHTVITSTVTIDINTGFYKFTNSLVDNTFKNGWTQIDNNFIQPIIDSIAVTASATAFPLTTCMWKEATREKFIVYVNGKLRKTGWTVAPNLVNAQSRVLTFTTALSAGDTITLKVFTDATPDTAYYEVPMGLEKNPLNLDLSTFTLGEINNHVSSIADNIDAFIGTVPGSASLRDLGNITPLGTKIVQHAAPLLPIAYHITNKNYNVINALKTARLDYAKFKRNLLRKATDYGYDGVTRIHLDLILKEIVKDFTKASPYYLSDMIPAGPSFIFEQEIIDDSITEYPLTFDFNLTTVSERAVLVYVNDELLVYGKDYEFVDVNFVKILSTIAAGDNLKIVQYEKTDGCFLPPTPTKYGLYPKFEPQIFVDTTYQSPTKVIQGHDGSITVAFNDYRDDLLLEFERRIYNNINLLYLASPLIFLASLYQVSAQHSTPVPV
jgi:hypothetical protein